MNYRVSKKTRKYSTTPVVRVIVDNDGNEIEHIVCIIPLPKKEGDVLAEKIVHLLNNNPIPFF